MEGPDSVLGLAMMMVAGEGGPQGRMSAKSPLSGAIRYAPFGFAMVLITLLG